MKLSVRPAAGVLAIAGLVAASSPALAICSSPRLITSNGTYVVTSGCEAADCGSDGVGVTDDFAGAFWALGDGDPAPGAGIDNGTFSALGNWLYTYPGYKAVINTTWAASTGIDLCIDAAADVQRCMGMLLTDRHPASGDGVFALLTRAPDALGNYYFEEQGDITLSPLGRLRIVGLLIDEVNGIVDVMVDGIDPSDLESALYLDPACAGSGGGGVADAVLGYEAFVTVLPNDSIPPSNSDADLWQKATGVIPLGQEMGFQVSCAGDESLWLRTGLAFDSEYRTPFLSEQTTRVECRNTLAEPDDLAPRKPRGRQLPRIKPGRRN